MVLEDLGCLLIDNRRSRAYIQKLAAKSLVPGFVICLRLEKRSVQATGGHPQDVGRAVDQAFENRRYFLYDPSLAGSSLLTGAAARPSRYASFDPDEPVENTLSRYGIRHSVMAVSGINDYEVAEAIREARQGYFVFGGGGMVRGPLFQTGKRFLHVHPGLVPFFRGSHCVEWSVLIGERCGATAFLMNETIDGGDVIASREFDFPELEAGGIPPLYSPHIRSELLVDVVGRYASTGYFEAGKQDMTKGETYYKMHPALANLVFHRLKG